LESGSRPHLCPMSSTLEEGKATLLSMGSAPLIRYGASLATLAEHSELCNTESPRSCIARHRSCDASLDNWSGSARLADNGGVAEPPGSGGTTGRRVMPTHAKESEDAVCTSSLSQPFSLASALKPGCESSVRLRLSTGDTTECFALKPDGDGCVPALCPTPKKTVSGEGFVDHWSELPNTGEARLPEYAMVLELSGDNLLVSLNSGRGFALKS